MRRIALIAHDNRKRELIEWSKYNREIMLKSEVYATGTTGKMLEQELGFYEQSCLRSLALWLMWVDDIMVQQFSLTVKTNYFTSCPETGI